MHLISFSLIISSNTSSPSPHFFFQTVSNRCIQDTDQSSFVSITGLFHWNRKKLQHKSAFNKPLFGKGNEISSRFLQCHATKRLQHPLTLPGSHQTHAPACQDVAKGYFQALASHSCTQLCWTALVLMLSLSQSQTIFLRCTWKKSPVTSFSPSKSKARNRKWKKPHRNRKHKQKTTQPNNNKSHQTPSFQSTHTKWQEIVTVVTLLPKYSEINSITDGFSLEVCTYNPHNIY